MDFQTTLDNEEQLLDKPREIINENHKIVPDEPISTVLLIIGSLLFFAEYYYLGNQRYCRG